MPKPPQRIVSSGSPVLDDGTSAHFVGGQGVGDNAVASRPGSSAAAAAAAAETVRGVLVSSGLDASAARAVRGRHVSVVPGAVRERPACYLDDGVAQTSSGPGAVAVPGAAAPAAMSVGAGPRPTGDADNAVLTPGPNDLLLAKGGGE